MEELKLDKYYTYKDYMQWSENVRYELINGIPCMMAPAPSESHQDISGNLYFQLKNFLTGKSCKVFYAPFDVCLNADGDDEKDVVQPDLLVVCDHNKLDGKRCNGTPDMIVEILSPSTLKHDTLVKFQKYQNAGVREYWIVDPVHETVQVCILDNNKYYVTMYGEKDKIPVKVLPGCKINMSKVFN